VVTGKRGVLLEMLVLVVLVVEVEVDVRDVVAGVDDVAGSAADGVELVVSGVAVGGCTTTGDVVVATARLVGILGYQPELPTGWERQRRKGDGERVHNGARRCREGWREYCREEVARICVRREDGGRAEPGLQLVAAMELAPLEKASARHGVREMSVG
jgi:hypothetical protein